MAPASPSPRRRSLSDRSRAQGFDATDERIAIYRSRWRAALRRILQRGIFRLVVRAAVTPGVEVNRRVRSIRGPYVLVANHTSHVDGPLLALSLPWTQARLLSTGVAADYWYSVWYRRLFVRWMLNAFPIDRDGSRKNSGTSRRLLRSGVPILVFPEGGRQKTGVMGPFNPGGAALAAGAGVPVVPAAIVGGFEAMPKGRYWPTKGRPPVGVIFGEPLEAEPDETITDFTARIRESVKSLYDDNYEKVLGVPQGRRTKDV
ncbi:MAG: lysophospholipid acyltransferase family protein [Brachybacterium sp.]|nr:lysophospholipid acyltransferase family protein [Brachybacterium sp.]